LIYWQTNTRGTGINVYYYLIMQIQTGNSLIRGSHYILVLKFKDFQGPWSCIFKDQFSMEVYSMDSITATCNIYFSDYGTVLVDKSKTW